MNTHELIAFDELEKQGFSVFFPRQDRGIDCVVTTKQLGRKFVPIQIKGSKKHGSGGAWFVIYKTKIDEIPDQIWLFVWPEVNQQGEFETLFLLIEARELSKRIDAVSKIGKGNRVDLYFTKVGEKTIQTRGLNKLNKAETARDFSRFIGNWKLIAKRLS
ncbi:MAG: hypothetical protein IH867_06740 [Chloroflexi bacterium]|nr:hypothetical protein [Chloroflexota bacterium]